eukprot:3939500-Ditylum_brightwellii.AAC.1
MADNHSVLANLTTANDVLVSQVKSLTNNHKKQQDEMRGIKTNIQDILQLVKDAKIKDNNVKNNKGNYQCNIRSGNQSYYCWTPSVTNGEHHQSSTRFSVVKNKECSSLGNRKLRKYVLFTAHVIAQNMHFIIIPAHQSIV